MKPLKTERIYRINDRIFLWLGRSVDNTKTKLCTELGMSKVTLNKRLKNNIWNRYEVSRLQELGIL